MQVLEPEVPGGPFRLSALLRDADGTEILRIDENEWRTPTTNWDVEVVGQLITLRRARGEVTLRLRADPPRALAVEKLDMEHRRNHILCEHGRLRIEAMGGNVLEAYGATVSDSRCAIALDRGSLTIGHEGSIHIEHLIVNPTGARVARTSERGNPSTPIIPVPKVGRNALCPCASGIKYKKCHGK